MKRPTILFVFLTMIAFAFEAVSETTLEEAPLTWKQAALTDGEALFVELCAVCHGMDAKGKGPAAAALANPVPDLTKLASQSLGFFPAKAVEKAISGETEILAHGTSEMPMWGRVFEDVRPDYKPARRRGFARWRILNLTLYLESIQVQ